MAEKEEVFSSAVKYDGIFNFKEFYKFCYDWFAEEKGITIKESNYSEKLAGDSKDIGIEWNGSKKLTDYFKLGVNIKMKLLNLKEVEIARGEAKIRTNKGGIKITAKGTLVRDYDGKFETTAFKKFLRSIYEKWVIPSRVEQFEDVVAGVCDGFLSEAKAYLDLEGRK